MPRRGLLPAADALALLVFVAVGLAQHREGGVPALFVRNALPLLVSWFVVAAIDGAYRRPGAKVLLLTWAVAVPAGLLVRTAWVGSPHGAQILVFLGVGLAFTLLFLLMGRALVWAVGRTLDRGRAPGAPDVLV
ncbi:MAG: DUF3054 domain-containing protein [Actinobacteria bacterium]|nr:DUF3054 domain-containing protein [Actinomycetota bacterium]